LKRKSEREAAFGKILELLCRGYVDIRVETAQRVKSNSNWALILGAGAFIAVLFISAYWEKDIRWLHFFQAWMYITTILLCLKGSRWTYFIGASIAGFGDYANLFVTSFLHAGIGQLVILLKTGHTARPDLFIAVPAWAANLVLLLACVYGYVSGKGKGWRDLVRLGTSLLFTTGYFALIMAAFQPRYLAIFPRLLHPHLNL
jgi:hypothetical protein